MIQQETYLKVADNTGAKELKCIRVLGGSKRKYGKHRRRYRLLPSAKRLPAAQVKKGDVVKAVVVRTVKRRSPRRRHLRPFRRERSCSYQH